MWGLRVELEGPIRRLRCPTCHKVRTEAVPWARPGSRFTRSFEDLVGLLAQRLDHTAVSELMRISWATVAQIARRLVAEKLPGNTSGLSVTSGCTGTKPGLAMSFRVG